MRITTMLLVASSGLAALTPALTQAGCGSGFCAVNTDWNVQGVYVESGARAELRYEYLNQDQPRAGSDAVEVGQIPAHHDEVSTVNQAVFATFDYNWASGWGASAIIPVIKREHEHIHNHHGAAIPEEWDFTALGDIRVAGRYQFEAGTANTAQPQTLGVLFGVKLPTGNTDVTNDEGELAERTLQPGTGTTDPFFGGFYQVQLPARGLSFFAQGAYAFAADSYDNYKPGDRLTLDLGMRYEATPHAALLLQLNALWRGRDSGAQAEPDDSGGRYFFISPGISVSVTPKVQLFALAQLPIYQYVNGVQLTASFGATAGIGLRF